MSTEQRTLAPLIEGLGFINALDKSSPEAQADDIVRLFYEAEQQVGCSDIAVFACELREETAELLARQGYLGDMYVQHPLKRVGQMLLSNIGMPPIEAQHHQLARRAWRGWKSGPAALTTARVHFAGEEQVIGGTHLTHWTGNQIAKRLEVPQLLEKLDEQAINLWVTDSNRGLLLKGGIHIVDAEHDAYFSGKPSLQLLRKIVSSIEQRFTVPAWQMLHDNGYVLSEETKGQVTWVPNPDNGEGWLDDLAARHGLGSTTDHLVVRGLVRATARVLSGHGFSTDHIPFIVSPT